LQECGCKKALIKEGTVMKLKKDKLNELQETYFNGNNRQFAKALGISPSHLNRFLNKGVGGGNAILGGVFKFCKEHELNFEDYIEI
jgi:hypothetical protein